jgi:hypothetical protein
VVDEVRPETQHFHLNPELVPKQHHVVDVPQCGGRGLFRSSAALYEPVPSTEFPEFFISFADNIFHVDVKDLFILLSGI